MDGRSVRRDSLSGKLTSEVIVGSKLDRFHAVPLESVQRADLFEGNVAPTDAVFRGCMSSVAGWIGKGL